MASIQEIRTQYPQYNDMSDQALADSLYEAHYSDMPRDQFDSKIGLEKPSPLNNLVDVNKGYYSGVATGAIDLALAPADVNSWLVNKGLDLAGRDSSKDTPAPSTKIEKELGLDYQPKSRGAKIAQTVGEFVPGSESLGPGVVKLGKKALEKGGEYIGKKLSGDATKVTSEGIKNFSRAGYTAAPEIGSQLKPDYVGKIFSEMAGPEPKTAWEKVAAERDPVRKILSEYETAKGSPMGVSDFEGFDKYLTSNINKEFKNGLSEDGQRLYEAQTKLRELVYNAMEADIVGGKKGFDTYREATKAWSDAKKLEDIENIFKRADGTANEAQVIRNGFVALKNSPKRMRGYNDEQKKLIIDAASANLPLEFLRTAGSRLISIGEVVSGHPAGAFLSPILSGAAREGSALMQTRRAQPLINSIAKPYEGKIPPPETGQ